MAGGNHTNAYATAQPNRFSLADTIAQQDQLNMHQQEQKRREQLLEEQRRDKLFERDEKLRERLLKIPQNYDTGSGSLNELQGRIIMQAINRKGEIYNQLRSGKISDSERVKLEIENQTLDNLPSNLKIATQNFTKLIGDYKKGVDDGSFFRNIDFESKVLNGFDNYLGSIDENGFPLIGFKDVNRDGKIDLMPWDNLKDGVGVWDFQKKLNYDKVVSELAKGLGTEKVKTVNGFNEKTTKGIPLKTAQVSATSLMYGPDGALTDFAKSRLTELGYDYRNANEDIVKGIERDVTERILNSKDREDLTDVDRSGQLAERKFAYDKSRDAKADAEKSKSGIGESVEPTKATWGDHYDTLASGAKSVSVTGKVNLEAIHTNTKGKDKVYSNVTINNYSYDNKGRMVISGSYPEGKTTKYITGSSFQDDKSTVTENKKMKTSVSKETEARIAKMLNTTTEELKQRAGFTEQNMKNNDPLGIL